MAVELWDEKHGNAVDDFDTEDEALSFVRKTIAERGGCSVQTWALDFSDDRPLVRGTELLRRVQSLPA
jgi:hypothetical protein